MKCRDDWIVHIPHNKLMAYADMIDKGLIRNVHVVYVRSTGRTLVEYDADHPHEWVIEELKKRTVRDI